MVLLLDRYMHRCAPVGNKWQSPIVRVTGVLHIHVAEGLAWHALYLSWTMDGRSCSADERGRRRLGHWAHMGGE